MPQDDALADRLGSRTTAGGRASRSGAGGEKVVKAAWRPVQGRCPRPTSAPRPRPGRRRPHAPSSSASLAAIRRSRPPRTRVAEGVGDLPAQRSARSASRWTKSTGWSKSGPGHSRRRPRRTAGKVAANTNATVQRQVELGLRGSKLGQLGVNRQFHRPNPHSIPRPRR